MDCAFVRSWLKMKHLVTYVQELFLLLCDGTNESLFLKLT